MSTDLANKICLNQTGFTELLTPQMNILKTIIPLQTDHLTN